MISKIQTKIVNAQSKLTVALLNVARKKDGLTTVEYAVAGALIAAAVVAAFMALGVEVANVLGTITGVIGG